MSPELVAILAVGVGLAGLILTGQRGLRTEFRAEIAQLRGDLAELRNDVAELRERMARLEGLLDGFIRRDRPEAAE